MYILHAFFSNTKLGPKLGNSRGDMDKAVLDHAVVVFAHVLLGEFDQAVLEGEQGEILADTHVVAGHEGVPLLANQDVASGNQLTRVKLNAQAFCLRVATVPSGSSSFLMRHSV